MREVRNPENSLRVEQFHLVQFRRKRSLHENTLILAGILRISVSIHRSVDVTLFIRLLPWAPPCAGQWWDTVR